jgi:murein DD-endopeptidase MepM/ murein hydrolase activator NlpD
MPSPHPSPRSSRALLCLLGLVACTRHHPEPKPQLTLPAAVVEISEPPVIPAQRTLANTVIHTIGPGETLWDIARTYGLSTQQIMEQNALQPKDSRRLRAGRQLTLSGTTRSAALSAKSAGELGNAPLPSVSDGTYHVLKSGESLWTLSRMYDVPLEAIMTRNGFSEDIHGHLQIGQAIAIPSASFEPHTEAPRPVVQKPGVRHDIARGETVWDIARDYGVSVAELMAANRLDADGVTNIREGQSLFLPGVEDDGRGHVKRTKTAREGRAKQVAQRLGLGTLQSAGMLLHGRVAPSWAAAAGGGKTFAGTLRWPVSQGWFVRGFGSGQGGYHKAMDIMGKIGWNVRAAADGIVGYAGDKVSGFGNMIMVVHPGGWVTLYAHNSVNFVSAGERVQKGSILAEVGSTGRSTGPHVHFELIYDGKNCDPAPLFRPGVRHRSGKISNLAYTSWQKPAQRPKAVQCAQRQKHPISVLSEDPVLDAQHIDDSQTREAPAVEDAATAPNSLPDALKIVPPAPPAAAGTPEPTARPAAIQRAPTPTPPPPSAAAAAHSASGLAPATPAGAPLGPPFPVARPVPSQLSAASPPAR